MHRVVFAAPNYLFALALLWAAGILAVSFTYDSDAFRYSEVPWQQQAAEAAGLPLLSTEGPDELRVWDRWYDDGYASNPSVVGYRLTADGIERHRLYEGRLLTRYAVWSDKIGDAVVSARLADLIEEISRLDHQTEAWCSFHDPGLFFEGLIDGRSFSYASQAYCDETPAAVRDAIAMIREISS